MQKRELTIKQQELLIFMAEFKHANQRPATMQEMMDHFKVTVSAIHQKLDSIRRRGIKY